MKSDYVIRFHTRSRISALHWAQREKEQHLFHTCIPIRIGNCN